MTTEKRKILIAVLSLLLIFTISCSTSTIPNGYIEYNSIEDEKYIEIKDEYNKSLDFSLHYPRDWDSGWQTDEFDAAYLIASDNLDQVFLNQDQDITTIHLDIDNEFFDAIASGDISLSIEDLTDILWFIMASATEIIEEPVEIDINGHHAAHTEIIYAGNNILMTVIIEGNTGMFVTATYPTEKESDIRPILDEIIGSIKLYNAE